MENKTSKNYEQRPLNKHGVGGSAISLEKIIWCAFRPALYDIKEDSDALIRKCIELVNTCPDIKVTVGFYYIELQTKTTDIKLWNANKWYAWLNRGSVNGRAFTNSMPKRGTAYDFKKILQTKGYDLFPSEPHRIRIDDVGC